MKNETSLTVNQAPSISLLSSAHRRWLQGPAAGSLLAAVAVLLLASLLLFSASRWYERQLLREQQVQADREATTRTQALAAAINRRLARLQALNAFTTAGASNDSFADDFAAFAAGLYAGSSSIRHVAVAPGGIIEHVYPLGENRSLIGREPALDSNARVRAAIQRAMATNDIVVSGPVALAEGEPGLRAWQAVYFNGAYWGLVEMVLELSPLLSEVGIGAPDNALQMAVRDADGQVFAGPDSLFAGDAVLADVALLDERWTLAVAPVGGWTAAVRTPVQLFRAGALLLAILLASITYLTVNRQARLALAVQERTLELAEREAQYRSVFESVTDALAIYDLEDGRIVDFNPAAYRGLGYTEEEFGQLQATDLVHPDDYHRLEEYFDQVRAGQEYRTWGRAVRKDGTFYHNHFVGIPFIYKGKPHTLAISRDVTELMQAQQLLEERVAERTRELSALLEISRNVASTLELNGLLSSLFEQIKNVVDFTAAAVLVVENDNEFILLDYRVPGPELTLPRRWGGDESNAQLAQELLHLKEPIIIPEVRADTEAATTWRRNAQKLLGEIPSYVASWMAIPLIVKNRTIGLLTFDHKQSSFYNPRHAELALALANHVAIAIENARLYEQAHSLAALQERQRLARELHDSVSQALYGIGLGTRTALSVLEGGDIEEKVATGLRQPLEYTMSLAEAGLAEMRALIFALRPESLETEGLVAALTRQTDALSARHGIEVQVTLACEPEASPATKEALYRVAQEALHNVVKHASASRVTVSLAQHNDGVVMEIRDDGQGFDPQGHFPGHLGLRSMRERIEEMGGSLLVRSAPGAGTCIQATVPG